MGILCQGGVAQIALANVNSDELYIGIEILSLTDGLAKQVAGHYDNGSALVDSLGDGSHTSVGGVLGGLVVSGLDVVLLAIGNHSLIAGLVKGFVVDVADVGNKGDLLSARSGLGTGASLSCSGSRAGSGRSGSAAIGRSAARQHCQHHDRSKNKRSDSLHVIQPPKKFATILSPPYSCTLCEKNQPEFSFLKFFSAQRSHFYDFYVKLPGLYGKSGSDQVKSILHILPSGEAVGENVL